MADSPRKPLLNWFLPMLRPRPRWDLPTTARLRLHPRVLEASHLAFQRSAARRLECGLFWYGIRDESGSGTVQGVVVPRQKSTSGNYNVPGWAIEEMSEHTRRFGWRNLAQVHTHPGLWVDHSAYDDECANSRNALSLVFPSYGRDLSGWPNAFGVHEFIDGEWRRLSDRRAGERFIVDQAAPDPTLIDLRRANQ